MFKQTDLLSLTNYSKEDILFLLDSAVKLKKQLKAGKSGKPLSGRTIAMYFNKPSLRTLATFETGIAQLGGYPLYLPALSVSIGERESAEDVAKNLERWVDALVIRTFKQEQVEQLASATSIPIINALTDDYHPCQALATGLTIKEHCGSFKGVKVAFVGDGNNVAVSLLELCAKLGMDAVLIGPKAYKIPAVKWNKISAEAAKNRATLSFSTDLKSGLKGVTFVYTDVWTSMGQESELYERNKIFKDYQINAKTMGFAAKGALFSHCLPAHRGFEVTSDVMDSSISVVFDEAENRLHVQKAVLKALIK